MLAPCSACDFGNDITDRFCGGCGLDLAIVAAQAATTRTPGASTSAAIRTLRPISEVSAVEAGYKAAAAAAAKASLGEARVARGHRSLDASITTKVAQVNCIESAPAARISPPEVPARAPRPADAQTMLAQRLMSLNKQSVIGPKSAEMAQPSSEDEKDMGQDQIDALFDT